MKPQIIKIWKAPKGTEAKYITVTESGELLQAWESLAAIRERYGHAVKTGGAILQRELDKVYQPVKR